MALFSFFGRSGARRSLAVDIGTTSIKAVEVSQGKHKPHLENYALLDGETSLARSQRALQSNTLKLFEQEIIELVKRVITALQPKTRDVVASLPAFGAFITVLRFPAMSATELEKAMSFQAKQYIPVPMSEVAIDWQKVGEYKDEKGFTYDQVLLISVPQEHIKKYQRIFHLVGLRLAALEVESLSVVRSLVGTDPTPTLIVDIGSHSTSIVVVDGAQLVFNGRTDYGGASLTQAVVKSLNVSPLRAEELKRGRGIVSAGPNYELSTIMLPFVDAILSEVKRVKEQYMSQFPSARSIERVVLCGGGASLLGIEKYAANVLSLPVVKGAPLVRFTYPHAIEALTPELNPLLSVALGLSLRGSL